MLTGQHLGQGLRQVLTQSREHAEALPSWGLPSTEREKGSTATRYDGCSPGRNWASWAQAQQSSQRHWGTSLPGEEHQNQEVTGGQAELSEGGWGGGRCGRAQHLNHRLAGCLPNSCLPAFKAAPAYTQGESIPASSSKSSCPRLPCS